MRISLFTHDANPGVDAPLCRKSKSYIRELIADGRGFMLNQYSCQLHPPRCLAINPEELVSPLSELASRASISDSEMQANAGAAETLPEIWRAQAKVKIWLKVWDKQATLPCGTYAVSA